MTAQNNNTAVFGVGFAYPMAVDSAGRMALSVEEETLFDSVHAIIENRKGSAPLNPTWGHGLVLFETLSGLDSEGYQLAQAILSSDPRIRTVDVTFLNGAAPGDILVTVVIGVVSGQFARTYPYFTAS